MLAEEFVAGVFVVEVVIDKGFYGVASLAAGHFVWCSQTVTAGYDVGYFVKTAVLFTEESPVKVDGARV